MSADIFVDTNIFLDAIDDSLAATAKRDIAHELLQTRKWGWSVQVAAEFFVNATSPKRRFRLASDLAQQLIEVWLSFPTAVITPDTVRGDSHSSTISDQLLGSGDSRIRYATWL